LADDGLGAAIAEATRPEAMPPELPGLLIARLGAGPAKAWPARGPAPVLWLLPIAASGAVAVLLALALRLGVPVAPLAAALDAGLLAGVQSASVLARLTALPTAVVAAAVSALLLARVQRMEAQHR
jgi:hypothetical protein